MRVLAFFLENPFSEAYLRELSRKLKMSASTVLRCLEKLEKAGLVSRRDEKNASFFKANLTQEFKAVKIAFSVSKIAKSGVLETIADKSRGLSCFLLFGSASKGEDALASDFDFVLIASESSVSAGELREKLGRDVNLKKYSIGEWKTVSRKNRAFYLDVMANSFALLGSKPVMD